MQSGRVFRGMSCAVATALVVLSGACDEALGLLESEPNVATIRLTVGGQSVTVSNDGTVSGGPLVLAVGANSITAAFLGAGGQPDGNVSAAAFQLNVEVLGGAPISFQRSTTNPFAGTLSASMSVQGAQLRFSLFHIEEQHHDFGPHQVAANVN